MERQRMLYGMFERIRAFLSNCHGIYGQREQERKRKQNIVSESKKSKTKVNVANT